MRLLALLTCLLSPAMASAQIPEPPEAPSEQDVATGREAFVRGMEHARTEAWAEASEAFLDSYRLSGSPVALLNAGTSLASVGRHRDATEALLRVVNEPGFDARTRAALESALEAASAEVGILTLHGLPDEGTRWLLDGTPQGPVRYQPLIVVLEPGDHRVVVEAPGRLPWVWQGVVTRGERVQRSVVFESLEDEAPPSGGDGPDEVLIGVLLGVAGAAILGGIVTAIAVNEAMQLDPRTSFVIELP